MLALLLVLLSAEPGAHAPQRRDAPPVLGDERVVPAIRRNTERFRRCGDRLPPGAQGRVVIRFSIDGDGYAHGLTEPEDTLQVPAVVTCLESALRSIGFGPTGIDTSPVEVPFFFRAAE